MNRRMEYLRQVTRQTDGSPDPQAQSVNGSEPPHSEARRIILSATLRSEVRALSQVLAHLAEVSTLGELVIVIEEYRLRADALFTSLGVGDGTT